MATEKWTPERRRQLTRDALIDAAAEVFAKRGFHGASLDEIAETAGFTRGAIYKNFGGKEDLFFAVNEKINQRALEGFAELLGSTGVGDVAAIAAKWKELIVGDFQFFTLVLEFNLDAMRNPDLHQRLIERRRHSTQMVAKFVEEQSARAGVKLAMPSEDLANIFLITTDGFTHAA
ncbi:MAG: TetR/AcrR family transcriptional regulator, partial [Actinobacteria bacterium]